MKKLLALMLSVAMVFTMGTSVFAYTDVEEGTYVSEAVTVLSNLGILDGYEDGSFKPEATVTRAEMAKIVCETLGYDSMGTSKTLFDDVSPKHWAGGYISTAYGLGIINGYGDGKFGPEDTVTYEQAVKMVVCALGYEPMAADRGGWSAGYTSVAANIGLTKGMSSSARGDITVLIYNALTTPVMEQTSYGSDARYEVLDGAGNKEYKTILTKRDIYIATGIVGDTFEKDEINFKVTRDSKDGEFKADKTITFLIGDSDIADYTHQEVEVYVTEDDGEYTALAVKAAKKTETFVLVSDDVTDVDGNKITYYVDSLNSSRTKTLTIDKGATVEYNKTVLFDIDNVTDEKVAADVVDTKITAKDKDGKDYRVEDIEITLIENDGDSSYDVVVMTEYTSAVIELVDADRDKMSFGTHNITFDFDEEDNTYIFVDEKGNELTLDDFAEDDVIAYVANNAKVKEATYVKIIKLSDSVITGKIDSVHSGDKVVTIDDEDYEVVSTIWNEKIFAPGTEGTFYIGITGKIVHYDDSTVKSNYGYILASGIDKDGFDDEVVIKMLTADGVDTYYLTDKVEAAYVTKVGSKGVVTWNNGAAVEAKRFVEYKLNSKGLISSLEWNVDSMVDYGLNGTYNADTEILDGNFVDKNTLVFVIGEDYEVDECYATDMRYFVDEGTYKGAVYTEDSDTEVVIVRYSDTAYSSEMGFAIVTGTSHMVDEDKNEVFAVDYVQNEIEDTIYFEEGEVIESDFTVGTAFVFNIGSDNYVNKYEVIAKVKDKDYVFVDKDNKAIEAGTITGPGKDVKVVFGTIDNIDRKTNSRGEVITIGTDSYVITSKTNKYTYDIERYKNKIEIEDFLAGDAYYKETEKNDEATTTYVTPVMLKLVDGVVVDIYTISSRIKTVTPNVAD